jgi:serine/threonine protein kinase
MELQIGSDVGRYKVSGVLGKGGMGEVYRAHDPQLNREVAVKTSLERFSERFDREAHAIAALNHPNICQIYDVGPNYLVMELVEGAAPAGPMELDEALNFATQIAAALQEAHAKGITHRDLKPGNIRITPQGTVKVLDFGLAKFGGDMPHASSEHSPTVSMGMTQAGMIVGTAAYMAPEQARGKPVDARADIWAFGVVLYELITGKQLFRGDDVTETLASVVKEKPDLTAVPYRVRRLLEACLEKDPSKRLQSIGDMRLLLDEEPPTLIAPLAPSSKTTRLAWVLAAAGIAGMVIALWAPWRTPLAPSGVVEFEIGAPPKNTFTNWMTLSPDGKNVAFTARRDDGQVQLWVRSADSLEARPVARTSTNPVPFWSHDSQWIVYQLDGKLRKVERTGGPSQVLSDAPNIFGSGSWNSSGVILFGGNEGIKKVTSGGGTPQLLTNIDSSKESGHNIPIFLPDGKHFIYHRASGTETSGEYVGSLDDTPETPPSARLIATESAALFAKIDDTSGYLLFRRERALMAQRFDTSRLTLTGEAKVVADPVGNMSRNQFLNAAVSPSTLIVRDTGLADVRQLIWLDSSGKAGESVTQTAQWTSFSLALDGSKAAATGSDGLGNFDIFTIDLTRKLTTKLTFDKAVDTSPVWSPDGSRIAFASEREGARNLYWKPSNGTTSEELLFKSPENKVPTSWSRDGRYLLFTSDGRKTRQDLWLLDLKDKKPTLVLGTEADESFGQFSPDGRFIAYRSDESGNSEIFVRSFPDGAGKWQISKGGGNNPRWSHDGKEIFYAWGAAMAAVKIATSPTVQISDPVTISTSYDGGSFDVARDRRILVAATGSLNSVNPIKVILNWQATLKK